jgi:hypothetical protein
VIYFAGYLPLYSWHAPIVDGNRLVLAQFIPVMFIITFGLHTLLGSSRLMIGEHSEPTAVMCSSPVLTVSAADEWVELHNKTASAVTLSGWTLRVADGSCGAVQSGQAMKAK